MAQYADIVNVNVIPERLAAGDGATIEVDVENLYAAVISISVTGIAYYYVPGVGYLPYTLSFQPSYANPDPETSFRFSAFFTMPTCTRMTAYINSYWYGSDGQWHLDDAVEVTIKEEGEPEEGEFSNFVISAVNKV